MEVQILRPTLVSHGKGRAKRNPGQGVKTLGEAEGDFRPPKGPDDRPGKIQVPEEASRSRLRQPAAKAPYRKRGFAPFFVPRDWGGDFFPFRKPVGKPIHTVTDSATVAGSLAAVRSAKVTQGFFSFLLEEGFAHPGV
jgi:hypothetical protein